MLAVKLPVEFESIARPVAGRQLSWFVIGRESLVVDAQNENQGPVVETTVAEDSLITYETLTYVPRFTFYYYWCHAIPGS
ncbi:MAG TPA: hypothetical protein VGG11_01580 [Xanthobacteraceae bacterium]|jgi:hypothetical protein